MRTELPGQLALCMVLVLVDVVRPGRALVTCGELDFGGEIVLDKYGATGRRDVYVVESEGEVIGRARSYREGAYLLAERNGLPRSSVTVEIEHEYKVC
ncbi:hypothetical protein ACL02T_15285 [Pseudonocardia sp. RS010]|uniref:hypothetical protein n=1 Tax=Pseudonocardia sp. RS010 TaxID=3385979 RepID=UPI00399F1883